ncbi:hypothetical protein C8046_06075 [Serinibacter arcticus]|uniref:Uncharacterized protein n=1 Tax=Serinibacter arcticus TaxID=1655435 RepID=A0A2U1ZTH9_9MICO|nr:HtaA domain-containing protein [Serinibacter arcticus]PWD50295.1 hypothetical protein C8046_06075 [Serinibacter arcticus]
MGLNVESGSGAFFGGCNFLSAGEVGDTGGGRVWAAADGFFATTDGNVTIEKPYATAGGLTERRTVPFSDRCLDPSGTPVSSASFVGTGIEAVIEGGTGTVDPATGSARIEWDGGVTVVFYGGLTYWWFTDPVLEVSQGRGTLTATAGGYGTDMADMTRWSALPATRVVLADLPAVPLGTQGFATLPSYRGVAVTLPAGASEQVLGAASSGSFPQSFVDFQAQTGQLAYWYSSGGLRDPAKPATTVYVSFDADAPIDAGEGSSGGVTPDPGAAVTCPTSRATAAPRRRACPARRAPTPAAAAPPPRPGARGPSPRPPSPRRRRSPCPAR